MRDLLEFAGAGDIEDVVTPVMQVIAAAADAAERGIAGDDAGERDGFLWCWLYVSHCVLPTILLHVVPSSAFAVASRKCRAAALHPVAKARPQRSARTIRLIAATAAVRR